MKRMWLLILTMTAGLVWGHPGKCAENRAGRWAAQLTGGRQFPQGPWGRGLNQAYVIGGKLRYHAFRSFSIDLSAMRAPEVAWLRQTRIRESFPEGIQETITSNYDKGISHVSLVVNNYLLHGDYRPFLAFGAGIYRPSLKSSFRLISAVESKSGKTRSHSVKLGFNIGAGMEASVNRWVTLELGVGYHMAQAGTRLLMVNTGLNVYTDAVNFPRHIGNIGSAYRGMISRSTDDRKGRYAIRVGAGAAIPISAEWRDRANTAALIGGTFRYHAFKRYALDVTGMYSPDTKIHTSTFTFGDFNPILPITILDTGQGTRTRSTGFMYATIVNNFFLRDGRTRPYLSIGTGWYQVRDIREELTETRGGARTASSNTDRRSALGFNTGAGIDVLIHPMASVTAGVQYHHVDGADMRMLSLNLGMSFYGN